MKSEVQNTTHGKSQLTSGPNSHAVHACETQMLLKFSLLGTFTFGVQPSHTQPSWEKKLVEKKTAKPRGKAIKFSADAEGCASEDKRLCC